MSSFEMVISELNLKPLPFEGGLYSETYRSAVTTPDGLSTATAIYYLITPENFSHMHRLPGDEIYHFYFGDSVEMLTLAEDGSGEVTYLGKDIVTGERPQVVVPGGLWQGARLLDGTGAVEGFALLGTTMSPGFDFKSYESGRREELTTRYPDFKEMIEGLTRA